MADTSLTSTSMEGRRRITLELSLTRIHQIDALKKEWGIRGRGDVLERLLDEIFSGSDVEDEPPEPLRQSIDSRSATAASATTLPSQPEPPPAAAGEAFPRPESAVAAGPDEEEEEALALVLIGRGSLEHQRAGAPGTEGESSAEADPPRSRGAGVDLPGFVQRRSSELRRSFRRERTGTEGAGRDPLPVLSLQLVHEAMEAAAQHWIGLYGKAADDTVLEAAMVWLGTEIWPQSDLSDGRTFTWSACGRLMAELVPGWSEGPPGFERVMAVAGVLEDPFSGATLSLRIPTLIRRFVQRFRRRRKGTSFQTLEHTMTLQGALRLLGLPIDPGRRFTLSQIREAYREQALNHHPDSGGSVESMRRLNEAYQLLKELYPSGDRRR